METTSRMQEVLRTGLVSIATTKEFLTALKLLLGKAKEAGIDKDIVDIIGDAAVVSSGALSAAQDMQTALFFRQVDNVIRVAKDKFNVEMPFREAVDLVLDIRSSGNSAAVKNALAGVPNAVTTLHDIVGSSFMSSKGQHAADKDE